MFQSGDILGHYRIISRLGAGGMADVYRVADTRLGREVALKILPPELARDGERIARFEKEVRATATLSHPHIVTVYDVGEARGNHYYAMELLEGGDLKARIRAGLSPEQSLKILHQMGEALSYAHTQGFVHRDIKPENILFDTAGRAKLTDLGIARAMNDSTRMTKTGMSIGTPYYMSPEQARGRALDGRSDLYSLGIVFHEMLTGQVPYNAEETFAVGLMHINEPLPRLPNELSRYQPLLDRLLAKRPEDRYADAGALIAAIDTLRTGGRLAPVVTAAPRSRRSHAWLWATLGGLLALVVLGGGYLWQSGQLPGIHARPVLGGGGDGGASSVAVNPGKAAPGTPLTALLGTPRGNPTLRAAPPPPPLASGEAILQVRSQPRGAQVFLDGHRLGQTPYLGQNLPSGMHQLQVKAPYYQPLRRRIRLTANVVSKQQLTLARGQGAITVLSQPVGATVTLDGHRQPGRTPLTLTQVSAGQHQIEIGKAKYYAQTLSVTVPVGATERESITLKGGNLVRYHGHWVSKADKTAALLKQAQIKARIKADKIVTLLKQADVALAVKPLSTSAGSKALAAYQAVLNLDAHNTSARQGIKQVAMDYVSMAAQLSHTTSIAQVNQAAKTIKDYLSEARNIWLGVPVPKGLKQRTQRLKRINTIVKAISGFNVPQSITITPKGRHAYAANYGNNTVSIIDTATNTVVKTISGFDYPQDIAITPNGRYAYVTNRDSAWFGSSTVSVIDTAANTVVKTISGFNVPVDIAITPKGHYAYVANKGNTVSVIDTATNTIVKTISGFDNPYGIAITPNGRYAYITNLGPNNSTGTTVSVIDTAINTIVKTIKGFDNPVGITITPNGRYAYVTNLWANNSTGATISVIDTAANTIMKTISGFNGPWGIAITPNGRYAYVTNYGNNTVSIIDTATNTVVKTISGFDSPGNIAITPNGRYAYVTNQGNGTVSVIQLP